jgi:hypothetical protein
MKTQIAYCSACDCDVRILVTDAPLHDAQAPVADADVVCLEIGEQCTGKLCPVGAVSPAAMMVRKVRSGVRSVLPPIVKAACEACGCVTDNYIVSPEYATCGECGGTVSREQLTPALGRDG